ncbi:hypothetical protein GCM10023086_59040 [Streptomyces venetus]|uniref:Transposase n=1 Tax=Streptomyces venetus TaxID=1701086 RepID=A0ABP8GTR2_9ACTN
MLPPFAARLQGGGTTPCDARGVFTAVVFALTSGCAWRHLDSLALKPLFRGIPAVRSRRGPRRHRLVKLRVSKAYFSTERLACPRERGLVAHIARPGIEPAKRLGRLWSPGRHLFADRSRIPIRLNPA